ncbi:MAG: sodium:calcium antiporter [Candidatus Limnocylindrales bacterium]
MDIVFLVVAFVVILAGAELFTNGIEWFGRKLDLAEGAVGSVLAAVGTALPETMIPIVAIAFAGSAGTVGDAHGIGVGAILGAPFMLATLAMFVTGVAVLAEARKRPTGDRLLIKTDVVGKDVAYFLVAYVLAISVAFVPENLGWLKIVAAALLIVIYAVYVRAHFIADPDVDASDLAPLRFHRIDRGQHRLDPKVPRLRVVNLQVIAALALIIAGAVVFVDAVQHLATQAGLPPTLLALVIAPIATELPEKFNSIIWVRQGKDTLAMGNITGAMVFQSCIPTVVALLFAADAWTVDLNSSESIITFASAGIAIAATVLIFWPMARRGALTGRNLLLGGVFYAAYVTLVVAHLAGWL